MRCGREGTTDGVNTVRQRSRYFVQLDLLASQDHRPDKQGKKDWDGGEWCQVRKERHGSSSKYFDREGVPRNQSFAH